MSVNVYEIVTERVIAAIERGVNPWRKPWKDSNRFRILGKNGDFHDVTSPINAITGKPYRGINVWLLFASETMFTDPRWLTFKQAQDAGGSVKRGEKGTLVVFWKMIETQDESVKEPGKMVKKRIPLLRYYTVFNVEQCENLNLKKIKQVEAQEPGTAVSPIESAEAILTGIKNPVNAVYHGGNRACYSPVKDTINMPNVESFETMEAYYATRFHEEAHATGHENRLKREFGGTFGDDRYSKEELVAEMTAAFLCAVTGIDADLDQSAAYVKGWLKKLNDDPKLVVFAASQAQKAADYILGIEPEGKEEAE